MRDSARNRSLKLSRPTPHRSLRLVLLLLALAAALLLLDQSGRLGPLRGQAQALVGPLLGGLRSLGLGLGGLGQGMRDTAQLQARVAELEQQLSALEADRLRSQALIQENEQLRRQLGIQQTQPWKLAGGDVLSYSPDGGRHMLLLSVGSDQGVAVGMAVITQVGTSPPSLIGLVESVGPRSAQVLLITDFGCSISARFYHGERSFDAVVQGQWQRGSRLLLEQIDRASQLAPGDNVVTAGLTARFGLDLPLAAVPAGVPIGTVEAVRMDGQDRVADVRPYNDPGQVRYAWVITSHDD